MIKHESSVEITKPVGDVFAFVDNLSQAPRWLEGCVEVRQLSPGPKAVGTQLHYVHRKGGRRGEMDGAVTAYDKNRRLGMRYADAMFDVAVEFRFTPTSTGTVVAHTCAITPKRLLGRLMSPLIGVANRKQVAHNVARLKGVLEGRS
ncbi:MAG TPA: SRPBCC family protein [Gemmatimonadales bacterium]|nr:SRPBCC family protein [Gemmatimonadales bacterium]